MDAEASVPGMPSGMAETKSLDGVVAPAPEAAGRPQARSATVDFIESFFVTILLALFGTSFVVQAFKIPSQSMEPTLLVGDHLLVNKFVFEGTGAWYDKYLPYRPVQRGDIIVFKFPYDDHPHYVKRVIGLPGDRIQIIDQRVYVNGKRWDEAYVVHDAMADDPFGDNFPPKPKDLMYLNSGLRPEWAKTMMTYVQNRALVVPPEHYFVMGDNRDRSWDSRYWGFVDRGSIMGRPAVIYWSVQATAQDYADRSLTGTAMGIEDTLTHVSKRTRWDRMLREVH